MSNHEFYSFIYLICRHFITPVLYGRLFVGLQEDIYLFSIKFLFTLSVKCASTNDIPIFFYLVNLTIKINIMILNLSKQELKKKELKKNNQKIICYLAKIEFILI